MVQEVTTQSWGSRIISAFWGILAGIALIVGSFILVFWNEGHGLHTAQSLEQTEKVVTTAPNSPIDQKNNHHAIYFSGRAITDNTLHDALFDISEKAIKLNRKVEMYQWEQHTETSTQKQMGGSEQETKTYTYKTVWSDKLIDSSDFKDKTGHENPESMPINSKSQEAKNVTVGDFVLPGDLISQMSGETPVDLSKIDLSKIESKTKKPVKLEEKEIYVGDDSTTPKVGDLRITVSEILPQVVSIIAEQADQTLQPFTPPAGEPVSLLVMGHHSPAQMISDAKSQNQMILIALRIASLIIMIIGMALLMKPIVVLADVIPLFGNIVGMGTGLIAFITGLILWTIATSIAWFAFRPLWAVGLILIVAGTCFLILSSRKRNKIIKPAK
ncbi:MAG: TMEM43 family protein [Gammaproteobacteria bacterium]|nr:TMEM43 family protein [Gammaproteobacteria bacterium]